MKCLLNICQQETVTATALAEAAENGFSLLSFKSEKYTDCVLDIQKGSQKYEVLSIYSPRYLAQNHYIDLNIDCSLLEKKSGPDQLKESEYKQLLGTLDKFVQHESWDTIDRDDGLEYKKYRGAGKKNYFAGYSQTIMKFRYSGKQRVFGYRKGDRFRVILIERDHKISNNG